VNPKLSKSSGSTATGVEIGTILSTFLTGYVSDHYSFAPILIAASLIPFGAMVLVMFLIRNTKASEEGLVRRIWYFSRKENGW